MPMYNVGLDFESGPCFIFRENTILVHTDDKLFLAAGDIARRYVEGHYAKDWFAEAPAGYHAVLVEDDTPAPAGYQWARMRTIFWAHHPLSDLACRARALLNWRYTSRFCSCCGGPTIDDKYETARRCLFCNEIYFPRICPAVIVRVQKDDAILLARHAQRNTDVYTCLAGYVEHGESLEQCVEREVYEETGLYVSNITYVGSQSWPFPGQLMIAYSAQWYSGDIHLQHEEIVEAAWFRSSDLPPIPQPGTIGHKLIMNLF